MDEIDAALDFRNVSIVANYIKERTKNAQFIIISLRNNMFELADRLIGIYKTHNRTKTITINPSMILPPVAFLRKKASLLRRTSTLTATGEDSNDHDNNRTRLLSTPLRLTNRNVSFTVPLKGGMVMGTPTKTRLFHRGSTDSVSSNSRSTSTVHSNTSSVRSTMKKKSVEQQN